MTITARIIPITDSTTLAECVKAAKAANMHLISNGFKVVVSPIIPPGFWKVAIKVKSANRADVQEVACSAA